MEHFIRFTVTTHRHETHGERQDHVIKAHVKSEAILNHPFLSIKDKNTSLVDMVHRMLLN